MLRPLVIILECPNCVGLFRNYRSLVLKWILPMFSHFSDYTQLEATRFGLSGAELRNYLFKLGQIIDKL